MSGEHGKYARPLAPCGSDAAYHRHLRHKETPCQPCKEAHWVALREWYQRSPRKRARTEEPAMPEPTLSDFTWHTRAACRGVDLAVFFPERGGTALKALSTCEQCPVQAKCLAFALDHGMTFGIYGGRTADERRKLRKAAVA